MYNQQKKGKEKRKRFDHKNGYKGPDMNKRIKEKKERDRKNIGEGNIT